MVTYYKVTDNKNRSPFVNIKGLRRVYKKGKWIHMLKPGFVFKNIDEAKHFMRTLIKHNVQAKDDLRLWKCRVKNARLVYDMMPIPYIGWRIALTGIKSWWHDHTNNYEAFYVENNRTGSHLFATHDIMLTFKIEVDIHEY